MMYLRCYFKLIFLTTFILTSLTIKAQEVALGSWVDQLPYSDGVEVITGNNKTYCATKSALFYVNNSTHEIKRFNLVNGLSDINITAMAFYQIGNTLIIGYENGNIDFITNEDKTINFPAIKNTVLNSSKSINNIYIKNDIAYLSCGFGIVVLDLAKTEVKDTYFIGDNGAFIDVTAVVEDNTTIYASTKTGVFFAKKDAQNLNHHVSWSKLPALGNSEYNNMVIFDGKIILNKESATFKKDSVFIRENNTWRVLFPDADINKINVNNSQERMNIASFDSFTSYDKTFKTKGFVFSYNGKPPQPNSVRFDKENNRFIVADKRYGLLFVINNWDSEIFLPEGPYARSSEEFDTKEDKVWVASGALPSKGRVFLKNGIYVKTASEWFSISPQNSKAIDTIVNIVTVAVDPFDKNHAFFGSWGAGIIEVKNNQVVQVLNYKNSKLPKSANNNTIVTALNFDSKGNLWIGCGFSNSPILIKPRNSSAFIDINQTLLDLDITTDFLFDREDKVWIISDKKLVILDYKTTLLDPQDDVSIIEESYSGTPLSIAKEKDGEIWLGTTKGLFVYFETDINSLKAERIIINQNGSAQFLLETETINTIKVDGNNRKWIGTEESGVFLISPNGQEQIFHFTTNNSPLFSNKIKDLTIQSQTGEVIFGTDKGMIVYKSNSTEPKLNFGNIEIYPNPVKASYEGVLAIRGLMEESDVRITDAAGRLVYKTKSIGGQAVWNLTQSNGQKAVPGVYFIFLISKTGVQSGAGKFAVIR